jgi:excisionase family DNA binding protein
MNALPSHDGFTSVRKQPTGSSATSASALDEANGGAAALLVTVVETARLLDCSRANVYGLIEAGELPVISIGRSRGYRIDRRDIEEFIRRRKFRKQGKKPAGPAPRLRLKHIKL